MTFLWLLTEKEAATGHTVFQWQSLHSNCVVLEDYLMLCGVYAVEEEWIVHSLSEELYLRLHQLLEMWVGIYVEWGGTSKHTECGYQADESETVVSVQVRYEYVVDEREVYVATA